MKGKYLIIGIFMAMLVTGMSNSAQAAGHDMDVYPMSTSACPCTTISEMRVSVTNLGSVSDTYELKLVLPDGWPSGFIGTYQGGNMITLGPKEKSNAGDITMYITTPCNAVPDTYTAKVVAVSKRTGEAVEKTFMIEMLKCRGVFINAENADLCKGIAKSYTFNVENEGKVAESFDISVTSDWEDMTRQTVTLEAGEAQQITVLLDVPEEYTGIQTFDIEAVSQSSYASTKKTVEINVRDCYKYDVYPTDSVKDVCIGEVAEFTFMVENTGLEEDTFNLITNDNVQLEKDSMTIAPKNQDSFKVSAVSYEEGPKEFTIEIASEYNPANIKTITGTVNAMECKGVTIGVTDGSETEKEVCYTKVAEFDVLVENTGSVPALFELSATAGILESDAIALEPGEKRTVKLRIDTKGMKPEDSMDAVVTASADGVESRSTFTVMTKNCFNAEMTIDSDDFGRQICVCDNVDYVIKVKNTGELMDIYELKFLDETKTFSLEPGEEKTYSYVYGTLGKDPGLKEFTALLRSPYVMREETVELDLDDLEACYAVDISVNGADKKNIESQVIENTQKVEVCEGVTFSLKVKNIGTKADSYILSSDGPEWAYLSEDAVILDVGEEREIYLYAAPFYETPLDIYPITVNVRSQKNATDEVGLVVNVLEKGALEDVGDEENATDGNVTDGNVTEPVNGTINDTDDELSNITLNMTIPTGSFVMGDVTGRAVIIGLIALVIIAILVIRFFVK